MSLFGKKSDPEIEPPLRQRPKYGIDEAIQLMRTLPLDQHPDLIVLVVKNTLASMNVSLKDTLRDAAVRHELVTKRIAELQVNIAELEEHIRSKREQVGAAETELAELNKVTERLEAAVSMHEPSITPPLAMAKPPMPHRLPPTPRSKPPLGTIKPESEAMELRESQIEIDRDAKTT